MDSKAKDLTKVSFAIAVMYAVFWAYSFLIGRHLPISDNLKNMMSLLVLYVIGLSLFVFITKDMADNKLPKEKLPFKSLLNCFFLQFSALVVSMLAIALSMLISKENIAESNNLSFFRLLSLLVIAPVLEELVFRYFMARKLNKYGSALFVLLSAFCFCIVHGVSAGIPTMIYTFLLGLLWAYLMIKTGNVLIPIIYHSLSNLFGGIIPQILLGYAEQFFSLYIILIIVFAIAGVILLIINRKDYALDDRIFSRNNLKTVFSSKGVLFLMLVTITFMIIKQLML
ncbi:MAG TPA: CPBP family intramembrane metalloprotease [Erysipelotrichaceae bacterium]|nr:CPBP family intramembrane metalloprotease [Erysipelotrichaceae bacterium]